jgi:hypothetical protein
VPKKLAVGARKSAMKGKQSATKRELIDAGEDKSAGGSTSPVARATPKKSPPR